ncbi:hypothetical protein [Saccharibacillus alkalitolerans]|uniref:DUF4181 domain-containing protein n=1 Tax=Saccharibacillus alkalitolerans TaxID=2705290 RepID=A0ABX0F3P9_9BACL|nr:hypothetical protein [Saccharibacillus alkalitolerans]NGZ74998.1 hypothetical protein [Saccharibacillus alkalitolerans]
MTLLPFLIVIVVVLGIYTLVHRMIVRGEDRRTLRDLGGRPSLYAYIANIVMIVAIAVLTFSELDKDIKFWAMLGIVALFALAQALLERRYLPNTRRHIATLLSFGILLALFAAYMAWNPLP